ncbi:MAG: DUF1697 domain-containing protein [Syntrophomonadaceae bacterium]|nr:DUF1697 domain-containing protein [Syntrophomonadaceae bacterium]
MKYAVLFRGRNIGGKNVVKMNDLKQLLLDLGLKKVKIFSPVFQCILEMT